MADFINENIFKKLNILDYKWENYSKYCPGATGLYLKHSDFHKIGQLLLNEGKYNNNQIISSSWIKEMCSMKLETPSVYKPERVLPKIGLVDERKAIQDDLARNNIKITDVCPGLIKTDFYIRANNELPKEIMENGLTLDDVAKTVKYVFELPHEITIPSIEVRHIKNY